MLRELIYPFPIIFIYIGCVLLLSTLRGGKEELKKIRKIDMSKGSSFRYGNVYHIYCSMIKMFIGELSVVERIAAYSCCIYIILFLKGERRSSGHRHTLEM